MVKANTLLDEGLRRQEDDLFIDMDELASELVLEVIRNSFSGSRPFTFGMVYEGDVDTMVGNFAETIQIPEDDRQVILGCVHHDMDQSETSRLLALGFKTKISLEDRPLIFPHTNILYLLVVDTSGDTVHQPIVVFDINQPDYISKGSSVMQGTLAHNFLVSAVGDAVRSVRGVIDGFVDGLGLDEPYGEGKEGNLVYRATRSVDYMYEDLVGDDKVQIARELEMRARRIFHRIYDSIDSISIESGRVFISARDF